jgi:nitrogen regulatory protein PII
MSEHPLTPRKVSSITCIIHRSLRKRISEHLKNIGIASTYIEVAKNVRQLIRPRLFGLPGTTKQLHDSPSEIIRFTVARQDSREVVNSIISAGELDTHGRGMIFSQEVKEYSRQETPELMHEKMHEKGGETDHSLLPDLSLITCILSTPGSSEELSRIALDLGTCVPVVSNGRGTGMRDKLGLVRITIPSEKEMVQLIVPEYDDDNIIRLLIEEGRLNYPGRGFLYSTLIKAGLVDTKLRLGRQEYAASIEQIISAIDELKASTSWRKRFSGLEDSFSASARSLLQGYREIVITCREGKSDFLVERAMDAGAPGATISRLTCLRLQKKEEQSAASERAIMCVPKDISDQITDSLVHCANDENDGVDSIRIHDTSHVFTHMS